MSIFAIPVTTKGDGSRTTGDLARWGSPKFGPPPRLNEAGEAFNLYKDTRPEHKLVEIIDGGNLPLMPVQAEWMEKVVDKYGFEVRSDKEGRD